jgi:hypothetical protein
MWIVGLFGFYIIYRLIFRWYMMSQIKMCYNSLSVPSFLRHSSFNYAIYATAFCIFCLSTYCFYRVSPWMVLLSPLLLVISAFVDRVMKSRKREKIIATAVRIQLSMESQGMSQAKISDAICTATLGDGYDLGQDWWPKPLLKNYILPTLGLFTTINTLTGDGNFAPRVLDRYEKDCKEFDAIIYRVYEHESKRQARASRASPS